MSHRRSFVAHHTRLRPVPGLPSIRLHLADDAVPVWQATEAATGASGAPIPFWAFGWAGGLAMTHYLEERPDEVRRGPSSTSRPAAGSSRSPRCEPARRA